MIPYFGGSDTSYYREFLLENGVRSMAFNWLNHRRRIKSNDWRLADYFPDDAKIFVDSGAAAYNREGVEVPGKEIQALSSDYYLFISQNLDRIDRYLEFDAQQLKNAGEVASIEGRRLGLDPVKGVVVWHSEAGEDELLRLSLERSNVAVSERADDDNGLAKIYRHIARQTNLHLIGAERSLLDAHIKWSSCHFSAWYSAQQHGETFIWAGHQLRRYMPDRRDGALKKYGPLLETLGLDLSKLGSGDPQESLKLSIWSWRQYFASIDHVVPTPAPENGPIPLTVTSTPNHVSDETAEEGPKEVARTDDDWRHDVVTQKAAAGAMERPKTLWPGVATESHTVYETDPDDGVRKPRTELRIAGVGENVMQCTGCYLAAICRKHKPGAKCAFNFAVPMSTKEQYSAGMDEAAAIQGGRMRFAVASEQAQGGFPTKEVSAEIDRYVKIIAAKNKMEQESFTLTIQAQQRGNNHAPGILSRLFGRDPEPARPDVPHSALETAGIVDAEVVSETSETSEPVESLRDGVTGSAENDHGTTSLQNSD